MASKKHNLSDIKLAMSLWPDIPAEAVPEGKRNLFERRKKAITMYADGCNVADVHSMTGVRCFIFQKYWTNVCNMIKMESSLDILL